MRYRSLSKRFAAHKSDFDVPISFTLIKTVDILMQTFVIKVTDMNRFCRTNMFEPV
jgi:hypothetical protein